jgi:hypothetical protein
MATVKGVLYFILLYAVPMFLLSQVAQFAPELVAGYEQLLKVFVATVIFFVVASEVTAGSILQYAFNVGKSLIIIIFVVLALNGGIVKLDFGIQGQGISIVADLRAYILALISIDLLGLAKSVLGAVNFLSEKAESQLPTLQPAS